MERKSKMSSTDSDNLKRAIRRKLLKGKTSASIIEWLVDEYGYQKTSAENILSQVRKDLRDYYEKDKENFIAEFNEKYNDLYEIAYANNNIIAAKQILDSQIKLTGILNQDVAVAFDPNKNVTISFGFNNNE